MPRRNQEYARVQTNSLSADEAEKLFATVDETGHTNEETAARQRRHRKDTGNGVDVDPLAGEDPSGSNIGKTIAKAASAFVIIAFVVIVGSQLYFGYVRRENTANLSESVSVSSVARALDGGVEWGNGFTQFPEDYSVQEADQNTGRIEVTVTDTTSETPLEVVAGSQVQATAFAVNSLLNPNINTVIYHVQVHKDAEGNIQRNSLHGRAQAVHDLHLDEDGEREQRGALQLHHCRHGRRPAGGAALADHLSLHPVGDSGHCHRVRRGLQRNGLQRHAGGLRGCGLKCGGRACCREGQLRFRHGGQLGRLEVEVIACQTHRLAVPREQPEQEANQRVG